MKIENQNPAKEKIINSLLDIFKEHIGINNAISSEELFFKVLNVHPESVDYYERTYKWNAIKRILSILRKNGTLFVIMGNTHHYVLGDEEEAESYSNKIDSMIRGMSAMKLKAKKWLTSEEFKKLKELKKKEKKVLKVLSSN